MDHWRRRKRVVQGFAPCRRKFVQVGSRTAIDIAICFAVENPNSYSGLLSGNAQVYCDKGTISASNLVMSNKGTVSKMNDVPEQKPSDEGDRQIIKFVCNRGKDQRQRIFPPTEEALKAAAKTGFLFIGIKKASPGVEKAEDVVRNVIWSNKASELMKEDLKTRDIGHYLTGDFQDSFFSSNQKSTCIMIKNESLD